MVFNNPTNSILKEQNEEISIKDILNKFKQWIYFNIKNWKLIFIFCVLGVLVGLFFSKFEKPKYTAVITFALEEEKGSGISSALNLASSLGFDLSNSNSNGAFASSNIAALMKSRLIIEKVLSQDVIIDNKKTTLFNYYLSIKNYKEKFINATNKDSITKLIFNQLSKTQNLNVSQKDKKVTILTIEVNSIDEKFSKLFCEGLARETSQLYIETKSKKARLNTSILQKQVDSVRRILSENIQNVTKSSDFIYNLNPSRNSKTAYSRQVQVDVNVNSEVLKQLMVQLEISKITLRKETPLIQLIDTPKLPLDQEKIGRFNFAIIGSIIAYILINIILYLRKV